MLSSFTRSLILDSWNLLTIQMLPPPFMQLLVNFQGKILKCKSFTFSLHANSIYFFFKIMVLKVNEIKSFCKPATFTNMEALYYCFYVYILLLNPASTVLLLLACKVQRWLCNLREALYLSPLWGCMCQAYWPTLQRAVKVGGLLQIKLKGKPHIVI